MVQHFLKGIRVGSPDMEGEVVFQGGFPPPLSEIESQVSKMAATSEQKTGKPSRRRASKTSKKAEASFEDRMEEKMRLSIESRFASFKEKIFSMLNSQNSITSGGCSTENVLPVSSANICTIGTSSVGRHSIPVDNVVNKEYLRPQGLEEDILSIQPGQRERNALDLATSASGESISESVSRAEGIDSRFSRYKSQVLSEETQNVLKDVFGEDAVTSKSDSVAGLRMDQSQADILLESWRSSQPDRLTAYKEHYKSSFPLHDKSEEVLKVPSLDDIVESFLF